MGHYEDDYAYDAEKRFRDREALVVKIRSDILSAMDGVTRLEGGPRNFRLAKDKLEEALFWLEN